LNFLVVNISGHAVFAQEKEIEIINSDELIIEKKGEETIRKLIGNVILKHDSTTLHCDSAYIFMEKKYVEAMSHVKAFTTKSVRMNCDRLTYDGDKKILELYDNITLIQNDAKLTTNRLTYFRNKSEGKYINHGRLSQPGSELVSQTGIYYANRDSADFFQKVVQTTEDYTLFTDTLHFHTKKKIATFHAPTKINGKNGRKMYTERGYYKSKEKEVLLYQNPTYTDSSFYLEADTIFYQDSTQNGWAHCNVFLRNRDSTYFSGGEQLYFDRNRNTTMLTEYPYAVQQSKKDTMVVFADTLLVIDDSLENNRKMIAYRNVKVTTKDVFAVADSMVYDRVDSLLKLFQNPIVWQDINQLMGDTVLVWMRQNKIDSIKVIAKCFAVSKEDSIFYNQVKGKRMFARFNIKNELVYMRVDGNSESVYLVKDGSKYIGLNQSNSKSLELELEENKPVKVRFLHKPQAVFYPLHEVWQNPIRLEGFRWLEALKPKRYY
jgi:lipopolysaccharide export system protein LptA